MRAKKIKDIDVNSISIKVYCDKGNPIAEGRYNEASNWAIIDTYEDDQDLEDEIVQKIESKQLNIDRY